MSKKLLVFVFVTSLCFALVYFLRDNKEITTKEKQEEIENLSDATTEEVSNELYGFKMDSFVVVNSEIKKNQNLSEILAPNKVSFDDIQKLSKDYKDVFDVRKIKPGKKYTLLLSNDSTQKAKYFIYESNSIEYVICSFNDSVSVCRISKDVDTLLTYVSGVITNSLYESIIDNGGNPELALMLSEVYAWEIDFFRLQKNDKYKIIYKQLMVDDKPVGIDQIVTANFNHMGYDYLSFQYKQGDQIAYFDENANSLQKEFLKAPLRFSRISSRFSRKRFHPVQKRYKAHLGTDYAAPTGTPIVSVGDGIVTEARYKRNNGNYVKVKHNGTYTTQYLHMSKIAKGIKPNQKVSQGQVIGYVGSTGLATGPHLCYRFWKNGQQIDATKVKIPPSKPISKEYLNDYYSKIRPWAVALDEIEYPKQNDFLPLAEK